MSFIACRTAGREAAHQLQELGKETRHRLLSNNLTHAIKVNASPERAAL